MEQPYNINRKWAIQFLNHALILTKKQKAKEIELKRQLKADLKCKLDEITNRYTGIIESEDYSQEELEAVKEKIEILRSRL